MHCNYFSSRIYVEKIFEQCYIGYHNSQIVREDVWDKYSSRGSDDQQVEGEDDSKDDI